MPRRIEIPAGSRYGRLIYVRDTVSRSGSGNRRRALFLCDCGNERELCVHDVRYGHTSSCGCFHTERIRAAKSHGATVGRRNPPEYMAWKAMKARCLDPNNISYKRYGGRGIQVCAAWLNSFEQFFADVGLKPTSEHSLDRINVNGNYEPANVRWATLQQQRRNTRLVHPVEVNGVVKLICEWAQVSGIPEESISGRLRNGWPARHAVFQPLGTRLKDLSAVTQ